MSRNLDAALAAIDEVLAVGAQTPLPDPTFGEVSPDVVPECVRCAYPIADGGICPACRAFLHGDSDDDPAEPTSSTEPIDWPPFVSESSHEQHMGRVTGEANRRSAVAVGPRRAVVAEVHVPASVPYHRALAWIDLAKRQNLHALAERGHTGNARHDIIGHHRRPAGPHRWTVTTSAERTPTNAPPPSPPSRPATVPD